MSTSSLACKGRTQKASKSKKKMVKIFGPKMFGLPLYLHNAAINTNQAWLKWPSIRNAQEKAKEKGGKDREKGGKNGGKKNKQTKKHLHAHTFSHRDPCGLRHDLW